MTALLKIKSELRLRFQAGGPLVADGCADAEDTVLLQRRAALGAGFHEP